MINTITHYLNELEAAGKDEKTIAAYRTVLNHFIEWLGETNGNADIDNITQVDVKDFKHYLMTVKQRKPATTNKALVVLKGFFDWAVEQELVSVNPAKRIKLVEKQKLAPKWLERKEQNALLRAVEQEKNPFKQARDRAIVQIMMQAGLRVEEVVNLEVDDISINCKSGKVVVRQGKRDKFREVPLNKDAREALKNYLAHRNKHKYSSSKYLFVSERNLQMTTRAIQHLIEKYGSMAKIEKLTAHMLRHTFCHNLILSGAGIEQVAMLAGHSTLESTKIYTVPGERELQKAVEKIATNE